MRNKCNLLAIVILCSFFHCQALEQSTKNHVTSRASTISCSDISTSGVVSAYTQPSFSIEDYDGLNISDYSWKLSIKDNNGNYTSYLTGNEETFTIDEITSSDSYYIDSNGMLDALLECDYTANGNQFSAQSLAFNIDLKPVILSIRDIVKTPGEEYTYTISFTVESRGANYILMSLGEESSTIVRLNYYYQPDYVNIVTGRVDQWRRCWIELEAKNQYGSTIRRLDFPVYSDPADASVELNTEAAGQESLITIHTLDGRIVFEGTKTTPFKDSLPAGIYILENQTDGKRKISKIAIP